MRWPAGASAPRRVVSDRQGGVLCRQRVQTGRRLMRQTVLPTIIHERTAPLRSESSARRFVSGGSCLARGPGLGFGLPLPPPLRTAASPTAPAAAKSSKMPNKMLIDATHPEETRVVVVRGNRVEEFDFETAQRKQLRGNIYLAKVTRVEPSLQAAFIEYGGNRHGFLAFSEIHPDYYQIPVADRQALIEADERAHREAEEESENRASRHRRPRHRNARRRGNGERMQSEVVNAENSEPPQAAQPHDHENHDHEHGENGHAHAHDAGHHQADADHHDHEGYEHSREHVHEHA